MFAQWFLTANEIRLQSPIMESEIFYKQYAAATNFIYLTLFSWVATIQVALRQTFEKRTHKSFDFLLAPIVSCYVVYLQILYYTRNKCLNQTFEKTSAWY